MSAVQDSKLNFDMLDKKNQSNIKFKRVNESTGKEVLWENITKGYLLNDKYVLLDDKDFEKASPEKTGHIEIAQFVQMAEIDPIYFETPYFKHPDKTGLRAYGLLKEALPKTGKAGVGSFIMREREHVCIIKPFENILVLTRLRFAEEIRDTPQIKSVAAKPKPAEIKMAMILIDQLTETFDPTLFKDEHSEKLMKIIKAKAKGKTVTYKPMKIVHSKTTDLMEQLKASLANKKRKHHDKTDAV